MSPGAPSGTADGETSAHLGNPGLKIGALVRVTVRKGWVSLASSCPYAEGFRQVHANLARLSPLVLRC